MITPFKLNAYFDDEDFKNFEYNELESEYCELSPIEILNREMDDLMLNEVVLLPYQEDEDEESPFEITMVPPTTPCTPTLHEEDEIEELITFTDEFITSIVETILRPVPTYAPCCSNTVSELTPVPDLSSHIPASSEEGKTTTTR